MLPPNTVPFLSELGLSYAEKERIISLIAEFKKEHEAEKDNVRFIIEETYLEEDCEVSEKEVLVVDISSRNSVGNYIHTLRISEGFGWSNETYKISLPAQAELNSVHRLNFKDFTIKKRFSGFQYRSKHGYNKIRNTENWLFIKSDEEIE